VLTSSKEQFLLVCEARKLYWYRLQFSSACLVRIFCIITEDYKCMWVIPCVTARKDLKNQLQSKRGLHLLKKIVKDRANLISRIESVSSVSYTVYIYKTHACISLLLALTMPLATSVTVYVTAQKVTDTTHVKPQWAKRFEVGSCTL
jgi:hypothetical protein